MVHLDGEETALELNRYLIQEEQLRPELNTWAAWIETHSRLPAHEELMLRIVTSRQLFTLELPVDPADEVLVELVSVELCRFLARQLDGVYQEDGRGFFTADGVLLLAES
jgi:hypothetical protein